MFARIASLALTLAVLTACDRPEPQDPPRTRTGTVDTEQTADRSGAGDRTRTQETQPPGAPASGQPAQGGQHYTAGDGLLEPSEGMGEAERQAALRACERLEATERERCEAEVYERSNQELTQRDD